MSKQKRLRKRADILKKRKMERRARKMRILKVKRQVREFYKKFAFERRMKKAQLKKLEKQVSFLKRQFVRARRGYVYARSLKRRQRKAAALSGARKAYFSTRAKAYQLRKSLRDIKADNMQKIHTVIRELLKLKIADAKMRIVEHKASIKATELYKKKLHKRIHQLNNLSRRIELNASNKKLLQSKIKINKRRIAHANRRIKVAQQGIKRQQMRIGLIHRKLRLLTIKEYNYMKSIILSIKRSIRVQKGVIRHAMYLIKCMGRNGKMRARFMMKKAKSEIRVLKVELKSLRMKVKAVNDAIAEEKKQRLTVTAIDYHRAKAAFHELRNNERRLNRDLKKVITFIGMKNNKAKADRLKAQYSRIMKQLLKIKSIKKKVVARFQELKKKYIQLKLQEEKEFMDKKRKWENRKNRIINTLNILAKKDKSFGLHLRRRCRRQKCFYIFNRRYNLILAHKLQIKLFRVNKKLIQLNEECARRAAMKSFRLMGKRFAKQKKAYKKVNLKRKDTKKQLADVNNKITKAEEVLPYLKDQAAGKKNVATLEKMKKKYVKKSIELVKRKKSIMMKYMVLNREFIEHLKKRMESDKKRVEELRKQRPEVLHKALYELIPRKQQRAERKLNNLDKELEALVERQITDKHKYEEAVRKNKFLAEAVKPKVQCKGGIVKCRYCHILGSIVKKAMAKREKDAIILKRL